MKNFRKFLVLAILILTVFTLSACSNVSLSANGYLWFKNPSAFKSNFKETLVYDVSLVHTTNSNSTEVKVDGYTLEIQEGTYTTTLEAKSDKNRNYYVYTTEFNLKANYVAPQESLEFTDTFKTVTEFNENLTPIKTTKDYRSEFSNFKYSYVLNYESDKATASLVESDVDGKYPHEQEFTFKKYTKGAFVDNDMILLVPRLYNISNSFSQQFKTIDVLSNKNYDMQYYAYLKDENVDVKVLSGYTLNGSAVGEDGIQCNHVQVIIDDNFSGNPIECYYAQDRDTHRHRLIETYTYFGSIGYLKYTLTSATVENDD